MKASAAIAILAAFLLGSCCQSTRPPALAPFKSDGCTCFPDGTPQKPNLWKRHCVDHDYSYWKGGTREERRQADLKLRDGIRSEGHPFTGEIAYAAVRMWGTPWLPTPWRWGFGWRGYPRGYRKITADEQRWMMKWCPPQRIFRPRKPHPPKPPFSCWS